MAVKTITNKEAELYLKRTDVVNMLQEISAGYVSEGAKNGLFAVEVLNYVIKKLNSLKEGEQNG